MEVNPYESPQIPEEPNRESDRPQHWLWNYVLLIVTGTLMGGGFGIGTYAILAADSPEYFQITMGWPSKEFWARAIFRGAWVGLTLGALLSATFVVAAGRMISGRFTFWRAANHFLWMGIGAVCLAGLAGTIAVMCADGMPDSMRRAFPHAPRVSLRFFRFVFVSVSFSALPFCAILFAGIRLFAVYREELRELGRQTAAANPPAAD